MHAVAAISNSHRPYVAQLSFSGLACLGLRLLNESINRAFVAKVTILVSSMSIKLGHQSDDARARIPRTKFLPPRLFDKPSFKLDEWVFLGGHVIWFSVLDSYLSNFVEPARRLATEFV